MPHGRRAARFRRLRKFTNGPAMESDSVLYSTEAAVATITLNRPDRLNALDNKMRQALSECFESVRREEGIRVVILTGAGRGFSSGGDIREMADLKTGHHSAPFRSFLEAGTELIRVIRRLPKPVLASVNGPAAGAGMNLALACDLRIASEQATFAQSFVKVGLHPDWGGTYFLPRMVGHGRAMEMFLLGEPVTAEEAHRLGLVNEVVPPERLAEATRRLALRLAEAPPIPIALLKAELYRRQNTELHLALESEVASQMKCFDSEDSMEGLRAFLEKRKPKWKGA